MKDRVTYDDWLYGAAIMRGKWDYLDGNKECPYPKGHPLRMSWWHGWLEARTAELLGV